MVSNMASYTVVLIRAADQFAQDLAAKVQERLVKRLTDLGLDPAQDIQVLNETSDLTRLSPDTPAVGAYFGGAIPPPGDLRLLALGELQRRAAFVLPIVPDLQGFTGYVPECLHAVNGDEASVEDVTERAAARLLESLGLLRRRRLVFISYRRKETEGAAVQLHDVLEKRSFEVFLDTYSVEKGAEFQPVLWDRMADADMIILLDSPGALKSRWVEEEITRAQAMGLGTLQLVWPGHSRDPSTALCDVRYLDAADFESPGHTSKEARLVTTCADEIAALAEALRARCTAARRKRIVSEVHDRATNLGLSAVIDCDGKTLLVKGPRAAVRVLPVIGHPDAVQMHGVDPHRTAPGRRPKPPAPDAWLIYDDLGIHVDRATHLSWLSGFLPVEAIPVSEVSAWLRQTVA